MVTDTARDTSTHLVVPLLYDIPTLLGPETTDAKIICGSNSGDSIELFVLEVRSDVPTISRRLRNEAG